MIARINEIESVNAVLVFYKRKRVVLRGRSPRERLIYEKPRVELGVVAISFARPAAVEGGNGEIAFGNIELNGSEFLYRKSFFSEVRKRRTGGYNVGVAIRGITYR